jgi:hypothetical protein
MMNTLVKIYILMLLTVQYLCFLINSNLIRPLHSDHEKSQEIIPFKLAQLSSIVQFKILEKKMNL